MGQNLFSGFKLWEAEYEPEKDRDKADNFISVIKKHVGVPKKLWFGMPILVSNTKIGDKFYREPTMFHVTDFDKHSVTIELIPDSGYTGDEEGEIDDEIDLDDTDNRSKESIILTRTEFVKLLEPQIPPGADMSAGLKGGM